jgi:3D (Asp-Asp-Asp) domain-containing protein
MSQVKARSTPTPQSLHRKRMLLIGSIVTVLPAAAFAPGLLSPAQPQTPLLAAVDEMAISAKAHADANEVALRSEVREHATAPGEPDARSVIVPVSEISALLIDESKTQMMATSTAIGPDATNLHWFNGRPVRPARKLAMLVTAYSPDAASCGESADGITASGYSVWTNGMKLVAADTSVLPFGSLISVPGYDAGNIVPVLDRGGAIKGNRLDVLYPTHEQATQWGAQRLEITVWEYADGQPGDFDIRYNSASAMR